MIICCSIKSEAYNSIQLNEEEEVETLLNSMPCAVCCAVPFCPVLHCTPANEWTEEILYIIIMWYVKFQFQFSLPFPCRCMCVYAWCNRVVRQTERNEWSSQNRKSVRYSIFIVIVSFSCIYAWCLCLCLMLRVCWWMQRHRVREGWSWSRRRGAGYAYS